MKIQMTTVLDVFLKFCSRPLLAVSGTGAPQHSRPALALEGEISSRAKSNKIGTADGDEPEPYLMPQNAVDSICSLISTQQLSICGILQPYSRTASPLHQLGRCAAEDNL